MTVINNTAHAVLIDQYMIAVQTKHMLSQRIISARTDREVQDAKAQKTVAMSWVRSLERIMVEGGHTNNDLVRIGQIAVDKLTPQTEDDGQ